MPKEDKERHEEEVAALLVIFKRLINAVEENDGQWETLEELMESRVDIAIRHAFDGFGMTYVDAIELLKNDTDLSWEMANKRNILIAAIDNLVDFSVAEEYQLASQLPDFDEWNEEDEEGEETEKMSDDELKHILGLFAKYNDRYAWVENLDIEYAMIVAAYLSVVKNETVLMYMTMGDERVRPWHLQYEGFTAPKSQFPQWLIPPIEHQCRCFLVEDTSSVIGKIHASVEVPEKPPHYDGVFKECVGLGGRIFSDEHSYFKIDKRYKIRLKNIADKIKTKYIPNYGS